MGTLASVHIYPLKGCRAVDLAESAVEPCGLAGDRRWLLMLGRRRRFGHALHFGQNLIPDSPGLIRVGDPVEVTEYAP